MTRLVALNPTENLGRSKCHPGSNRVFRSSGSPVWQEHLAVRTSGSRGGVYRPGWQSAARRLCKTRELWDLAAFYACFCIQTRATHDIPTRMNRETTVADRSVDSAYVLGRLDHRWKGISRCVTATLAKEV